ncbi:tubulin-folding cofactor B [Engraulis encrasicolus]|uniref:tubulin-folding cofactor B n=1 Tax=Engraulis encrasicolus TaxID=184585 RepID=UPI002FD5E39C
MENNGIQIISNPAVDVRLTSTLTQFESRKRFNRGLTIADFKSRLELVVGVPATCMDLELYSGLDKFLVKLSDDDALLGSYPVDDDCRIHVIDRSGGQGAEFGNVAEVEKYEISEDAYAKRGESVRSFMKKNKFGRFNEEEKAKKDEESKAAEEKEEAACANISVGSRCQVRVVGQPTKLGMVMYVGTTDFKPGYWVGVKYDEPLGKHDGTVSGKRYFECEMKYGGFVRPTSVTCGDFPEEDYLDEM